MDASSGRGDPTQAELYKLLEWELSLDSNDLRSHGWYHGTVPRARAEEVVMQDGQFIIRDCISQPGDYVLTCYWNGQVMHFVIQKTVQQPDTVYERIQYQLENEAFDTIPDLVTAYVGGRVTITASSGARIASPVNRTAPLSFYASKYASQTAQTLAHGTLTRYPHTHQKNNILASPRGPVSVGCSIVRSTPHVHSPPKLRSNSGCTTRPPRPTSEINLQDAPSTVTTNALPQNTNFSSNSLPRRFQSSPLSTLSSSPEPTNAPPKPSRVLSQKNPPKSAPPCGSGECVYSEIDEADDDDSCVTPTGPPANPLSSSNGTSLCRLVRISDVYQPGGSDSGNGSGDSVQTNASEHRSHTLLNDASLTLGESDSLVGEDNALIPLLLPPLASPSCFNLDTFSTLLLPSGENKPLDHTALRGVKNALVESGSRVLAAHLTKIDLETLNGCGDRDYGLGVGMGIELITLPQGEQIRKDLIERTECLKFLVMITILKTEDICERANIVHRWIQVAMDTKTCMGNLYGFSAIMLGLCAPEIQRLSQTWHLLRQQHTDSAFCYESRLRATMKAMNECSNPQAPNTVIPHLLPFVLLCERDLEDIYSMHNKCDSLLQWESTSSDYGLQLILLHLQEGRAFAQNLDTYKRNSELLQAEFSQLDELTLDVFRSEFHLKFLFGSRGAAGDASMRNAKFQRVIEALSLHRETEME